MTPLLPVVPDKPVPSSLRAAPVMDRPAEPEAAVETETATPVAPEFEHDKQPQERSSETKKSRQSGGVTIPATQLTLRNGLAMPGMVLTKVSLSVSDDVTLPKLRDCLSKLATADEAVRWWVGDLCAAAERKWGKWDELVKDLKLPWGRKTLQNFASVAKSVESSRRRELLPWGTQAEVAGLPAEEQTKWLDEAQKCHLSRARLRYSIAAGKVVAKKVKAVAIEPIGRLKLQDAEDGHMFLQQLLDKLPTPMEVATCEDGTVLAQWQLALRPLREFCATLDSRWRQVVASPAQATPPVVAKPILLGGRLLPEKMNGKPVYDVSAKSVINFHSGFGHKLLCDDLTFSLGSACAYKCRYCYVGPMMAKSPHLKEVHESDPAAKHEDIVIRREGALATLRRQLTDRHGDPKFGDDTRVIYASPLVDVAANSELADETIEACRIILELTRWHIRLLSKSNLLSRIAKALDTKDARKRLIFGVSTGTLDDNLARSFECGTALVSKRIASLHALQDQGWRTFGMICPSLPQHDYTKFANEMAAAIRFEKCEHIWAEVLNARGESMRRTCQSLRGGGYEWEAAELERVAQDKVAWEQYARDTFEAHAKVYGGATVSVAAVPSSKLRFLQYVTKETRDWWTARQDAGAILL